MKHYLYVSDSKVDMFYSQIPERQGRSISAALKIDLKLFAIDLTAKPSEETRYSKLKVPDEYVRSHEDGGAVDRENCQDWI
jgi:uncharacterized protein DUF7019